MATGTRKPPKKKKAAKKTAKKSGKKRKPSNGKFKVVKAVGTALGYIAAVGGVVAGAGAASSIIEGKTDKPLHPAARAAVSLGTSLALAFAAIKLKKKAIAATIMTAGTVKAGVDALPVFEDAGQKVASKVQKALPSKEAGTTAAGGISSPRPRSGSRDLVN